MSKPLESRPGQKQPVTAESLLAPEGIESLVISERVPGILEHTRGAWAVVPPEGTQLGDKITHGMGVGIGDQGYVTFESPDGVKRGPAALVDITPEQAKEIRLRVAKTLKSLKR